MTASSVANRKESGVVKATLTASAVVVNAEVSYTLTFHRWCLGCSLMFKVNTATGDYKTKYPGTAESTPTAKVNLYIVIHSAVASRVLAFRYGTSPWASYWQKYDATTVAANLPSTAIGTAMTFKNTCFSTEKSTCNPRGVVVPADSVRRTDGWDEPPDHILQQWRRHTTTKQQKKNFVRF